MSRAPFAVVFLLASLRLGAQPCEPTPEIKAAIDKAIPSGASRDAIIEAAKKLREEFPSDYFVHRRYQDFFLTVGLFNKDVQQEYRTLADAHAEDILYTVLYARTLKGTNTPELIKLLDGVLALDPENPQAHLKLVEVYSAPAFRDDAKLQAHAEAYWKACPTSLEGYTYIRQIEGREFAQNTAVRLRPLIESKNDDQALGLYGTLWTLEFKSVPLSAQDPVRQHIRKDIDRLRAMDPKPSLLIELRQGYETLGDQEGLKWVSDQMAKSGMPGATSSAAQMAISEWMHANPSKSGSQRDIYIEKLLKQTDEWIRKWPDDAQARYQRFWAMQWADGVALDDMITAGQDWLRVYEKHRSYMAPYVSLADFYSRYHIHYSDIPALLEKAIKQEGDPSQTSAPVSDLYPPNSQAMFARLYTAVDTWQSTARIYLSVKNYDRALELLDKVAGSAIFKNKPADSASQGEKSRYQSVEFQYWTNMAKLARGEGRLLDAMTYERNSIFANPATSSMQPFQRNSLLEQWKELKGSEDGFDAFITKPGARAPAATAAKATVAPVQSGWAKLDKPLPDFELEDAAGKTWHLADLKGKVTLVNLWATWCGPCKEELPHLQKLYDKVRERKDLAVLTLNTDDNLGLIVPFLKKNHYTFPVVAAGDYVHKLVPELSIPRNWIVSADGVLREEKIGFGSGGADRWVEEIISDMEKAASPATTAAAQTEHQHHHPPSDPAEYARALEDPSRDAWQKPHEVISALDIKPTEVIADLGSGSGYFTRRLAMHAAKVYAVDIEPGLLEILKKNAPKNVEPVLAAPDDPKLAPESVDTVFICEVLHHIENRSAYLAKLAGVLKPGGRIVVIDFIKGKKTPGPPEEMKLSEDHVRQEFAAAGFRNVQKLDILPEQYFLVFKR